MTSASSHGLGIPRFAIAWAWNRKSTRKMLIHLKSSSPDWGASSEQIWALVPSRFYTLNVGFRPQADLGVETKQTPRTRG